MNDKKIKIPVLDKRLALAASFVRRGAVVADIGTDHAYLPIFLVMTGKSPHAVAADINEGPLERARINCERCLLTDKITLCLSDGLTNIPLDKLGVSDIVICGMGGELIAEILEKSDYTRNCGVRLILQPMSQAARLRTYLAKRGYRTVDGSMTEAQKKIYQCIVCEYDGIPRTLTKAEAHLGAENIYAKPTPVFIKAAKSLMEKTERAVAGMHEGGLDTSYEIDLICELVKILNNIKEQNNEDN